ncbi:TSUP family transporter [Pontixanthobacter gangjinensis]|uniref:Probable membrane transporter protein n=1 Tax=Pontixanthobacter gangjinensis TaxID=1028742 RepID=A0A6I4SPL8_9SPHN|nr:TSUP family transporter [Pontixanthobacter gangjinensis]MXO57090.1 TSUP family transporter [Pontixanthobacter gangjinensis]
MIESFEPEVWLLIAMFGVAILTGFIDSIAGGGGLIMMPALLAAGLPPHLAIGTNKAQSVFGTSMACRNYWKGGLVEVRENLPLVALAFAGATGGAILIQQISATVLSYIVPVFLLGLAVYVIFSPRMTDEDAHQRLSRKGYASVAGGIGFYDGFFGPGTGQFFTASLVGLRGHGLTRATGNAKLFNAATNWASVLVFALGGKIIWVLGLTMAVGAMLGGFLGSRFAIKHGARIIRPLMIVASLGLTGKLIWDLFAA